MSGVFENQDSAIIQRDLGGGMPSFGRIDYATQLCYKQTVSDALAGVVGHGGWNPPPRNPCLTP